MSRESWCRDSTSTTSSSSTFSTPSVKPGIPIDAPLAFDLPAYPIPPGRGYESRLTIDGETRDDRRLAFSARPQPGTPASG
jgi:hypothetical protein